MQFVMFAENTTASKQNRSQAKLLQINATVCEPANDNITADVARNEDERNLLQFPRHRVRTSYLNINTPFGAI